MHIKNVASRVMVVVAFVCLLSGAPLAQQKKGDVEITALAAGLRSASAAISNPPASRAPACSSLHRSFRASPSAARPDTSLRGRTKSAEG